MALIRAGGADDGPIRQQLLDVLKDGLQHSVGPMQVSDFTMLHLVASLYTSGITGEREWWALYPGRTGAAKPALTGFLSYAAKLFQRQYPGELLIRHTNAQHSRDARGNDYANAVENQLNTVMVNPDLSATLPGKNVLLIDDFITYGPTTECARNMLLKAGASDVVSVAIGKYGPSIRLFAIQEEAGHTWDPYSDAPQFEHVTHEYRYRTGMQDSAALDEFYASYRAMEAEAW
jgi:hypoxanthine phosphoribosyltransferase